MLAALSLGLLAAACGGGGNKLVVGGLVALFTADAPSADPRISMEPGPSAGDVFTVEIRAAGITDLYGAAFTVLYDPAEATYLGCEAQGSVLSTNPGLTNDCDDALVGGAKFTAALENGIPGILNIRASKDGLLPGVAVGTGLLLTLTFRADGEIPAPGEPYVFENVQPPSREVEACPQDLSPCSFPAVAWDGGTLTALLI
jgi:hypothetical protein